MARKELLSIYVPQSKRDQRPVERFISTPPIEHRPRCGGYDAHYRRANR